MAETNKQKIWHGINNKSVRQTGKDWDRKIAGLLIPSSISCTVLSLFICIFCMTFNSIASELNCKLIEKSKFKSVFCFYGNNCVGVTKYNDKEIGDRNILTISYGNHKYYFAERSTDDGISGIDIYGSNEISFAFINNLLLIEIPTAATRSRDSMLLLLSVRNNNIKILDIIDVHHYTFVSTPIYTSDEIKKYAPSYDHFIYPWTRSNVKINVQDYDHDGKYEFPIMISVADIREYEVVVPLYIQINENTMTFDPNPKLYKIFLKNSIKQNKCLQQVIYSYLTHRKLKCIPRYSFSSDENTFISELKHNRINRLLHINPSKLYFKKCN